MRRCGAPVSRSVSRRLRAMITRLLMAVSVVGGSPASPVEAGTPHDRPVGGELSGARVGPIPPQLARHGGQGGPFRRRAVAPGDNIPTMPDR